MARTKVSKTTRFCFYDRAGLGASDSRKPPVEIPPQDPGQAMWLSQQKQIARLSTSSILVRADTSGHSIAIDQPNLTGEAFRQVLAAVRGHRALPTCAQTLLPRWHGTCLDPNSP